jgi:hypothetical protein
MRPTFVIALALAGATAASAQPAQDRYGPPRPARERAFQVAALRGYQGPLLGWANKRTTPAPPAAPAAQPEFAPTPAPVAMSAPAPRPQALPQPQRMAYAPVRPQPTAAPQAPPHHDAGAGPRYYSLHREYGLAPDTIPEQSAEPRYVLIGPPDSDAPKTSSKTSNDDGAF